MKDIKGYEGLYAITSCGRVWSYTSKKFISITKNTFGYPQVLLWKNNKCKSFRVHRLVATTYIPNPENLPQVNHKDEVKTHNWINNLEWCSAKYNTNYGTAIARRTEKRSIKIKCLETGEEFESLMDCHRKLNVSIGNLSEHLKGSAKRSHVNGLHFERIDK